MNDDGDNNVTIDYSPTGSVRRVERSPPERKVVSFSHSRVMPKDLKNGELNALGPPTQDPH